MVTDKQVEIWARALACRWRGNDDNWRLFEPYIRDTLAILDVPSRLADARHEATAAAAEAAVRYLETEPEPCAEALRAAVLGSGRTIAPPLADAAE